MTEEQDSDRRPATPLWVVGSGGVLGWLVHPVTIAALVLLLVNDHLLKAAFPGLLTGKLSDVAGLVMTPPVLAVVLAVGAPWLTPNARAAVAVATVGVGFAAVKASQPVADYASSLWSVVNGPSVVLADETDLIALPALGLAWWTWRAVRVGVDLGRWARLLGVLVVLPTATIAIAATSPPRYDDAVSLLEWRGRLLVGIGDSYPQGTRDAARYRVSDDDGLTFHSLSDEDEEAFLSDEPTLERAGARDCSSARPNRCFRVVPGHLRVEETADSGATWRTCWQVTDPERTRLAVKFPELEDVAEYLSSRALIVRDRPDGGLVVIVANGRDGFARRDATGEWSRIGFGVIVDPSFRVTEPPESIPGLNPVTLPRIMPVPTVLAVILGAGVICMGLLAAGFRSRRPGLGLGGLFSVWFGAMPALLGASGRSLGWELAMAVGIGLVVLGVSVTVWLSLDQRIVTRAGAGWIGLLGIACGLGVLAPYVAWLGVGWPPRRSASIFGALATILTAAGSVLIGLRHATGRPAAAPARQP